MRARIRLLRHRGALLSPRGPDEGWHEGLLETENHTRGTSTVRRLVLRQYMSAPGMGLVAALYQAHVVEVNHDGMRLRGLEEVPADGGKVAGVLQEWAVQIPPPDPFVGHSPRRQEVQTA